LEKKREHTLLQSTYGNVAVKKIKLAQTVVTGLKRRLRTNLLAAGAYGSVARGTAEKYSDIDLLILVN
jgi:predicted nucleotidyltransferase